MKKFLSVLLLLAVVVFAVSCTPLPEETDGSNSSQSAESPEISDSEENNSDADTDESVSPTDKDGIMILGSGENKIIVKVVTKTETYCFDIYTDSEILGMALTETGLVEGEQGPYGLYIKKVYGISAVYETDGAYWALLVNGESAATGADSIRINEADTYELVYTLA